MEESSHLWQLSVILLEGLRLMRPEKAWRPIITVEIDKHLMHESTLGVDGQNVNRKDCFRFEPVPLTSKVDINVFHTPQTKKKKGRILVARASHTLGELVKKKEADAEHKVKIRLQCRAADQKPQGAARGRMQKGAMLIMRLHPPTLPPPPSSTIRKGLAAEASLRDLVNIPSVREELPPLDPLVPRANPLAKETKEDAVEGLISREDDGLVASVSDPSTNNDTGTVPPSSSPSTPTHPTPSSSTLTPFDSPPESSTLRHRRPKKPKFRGYTIDTDDECGFSSSSSSSCSSITLEDILDRSRDETFKIRVTDYSGCDDAERDGDDGDDVDEECDERTKLLKGVKGVNGVTEEGEEEGYYEKRLRWRRNSQGEIISFCAEENEWIAASEDHLLPRYTEKVVIPGKFSLSNTSINTIKANGEEMIWCERVLASLTMYGELCAATKEDEFEKVFRRLQYEWTFVGGLLVALAAVDTAVFSISPDSLFNVDGYARAAVAVSSIASGLGIACTAWFLLRYNWADLNTFIIRAQDLFESYLFFSLSARMPGVCMFVSSLSLMTFLGLVAFDVWPTGVLVMCFVVGIIMTLQFLVYGVHWVGRRVVQGGKAGGVHVVTAVRRVRGMTVASQA